MLSDNYLRPISKAQHEYTSLVPILKVHFGESMNLARIKLLSLVVASLCKVQTVNLDRIACGMDSSRQKDSNLRRLQRFIAFYIFDQTLMTKLIFRLLPKNDGKIALSLDRTNWKFGEANINILMIGVVCKGVACPLMFEMLDKRGNSNTFERIKLLELYGEIFGFETIEYLVADREFVGNQWLEYLNQNEIQYTIRIRENFDVIIPRNNKKVKASWLFSQLKLGDFSHYPKIVIINQIECYLSAGVIKSKTGEPEYQFLISFNNPSKSKSNYADRWQIETMFKALKSSGFNLEDTHITHLERIQKLLSIVLIAFIWCYKVGEYIDLNIRPIKIKKHGYRAKSIFKYGLDYIALQMLNTKTQVDINVFSFLSCS